MNNINKSIIYLLFILIPVITSCSSQETGMISITDETIKNYINAYTSLKEVAPKFAMRLACNPQLDHRASTTPDQYYQIRRAIKDSGFTDYNEFARIHSKIAWTYILLHSHTGMRRFNRMHQIAEEELRAYINNPNIPANIRRKLKRDLAEQKKSYYQNRKYTDLTVKETDRITARFTDRKIIQVVETYMNDLLKVYSGYKLPHSLPNSETIDIYR